MRFSKTELQHLGRAWLLITIAFALLLNGGFSADYAFAAVLVISAITVGLGFLLHELAHKFVAQRYGCIAEFRAFDSMLLFGFVILVLSNFSFILAAPGAVMIHGNINMARNGRISAVGPLVNIMLAIAFFATAALAAVFFPQALLLQIAFYGTSINAWLAVFNLLPFWQLDGAKVLAWNKKAYAAMMAAAVAAMMLPGLLFS